MYISVSPKSLLQQIECFEKQVPKSQLFFRMLTVDTNTLQYNNKQLSAQEIEHTVYRIHYRRHFKVLSPFWGDYLNKINKIFDEYVKK